MKQKTSSVVVTYPRGSTRIAYTGTDPDRARKVYKTIQDRALGGKGKAIKRIDLMVAGYWAATQTIPEGWGKYRKAAKHHGA